MTEHVLREIFPLTSDEDAELMLPLYNTVWKELNPHHRPVTVADYRSRADRPTMTVWHFVATDSDGAVVGLVIPAHFTDGSNAHLQWLQLLVDPGHRRSGVGKTLLSKAHDIAVADGRTVLTIDTFESMPAGVAFSEAVHAEIGIREHINIVDVDALDFGMLERWRSEGPSRAPGYEVLIWEDDYPEECYGAIAELFVMADEDMPMEDLDMEPFATSADDVRDWIAKAKNVMEFITVVARHIESGELVGFSELLYRFSDPDTMQTTLTMVHRDHRGHALGKWIKAAAILRGVERWPGAVRIKTENAKSNDAMLGINTEIGFEPQNSVLGYQATTDVIAAYLKGV
ncbi:MAG: GNAT family N-acetyltransferase [Armatimonadetes bacterium]|nr:MAG: GNAT family N-acetyltransferase [Armatimonadota bacterium]